VIAEAKTLRYFIYLHPHTYDLAAKEVRQPSRRKLPRIPIRFREGQRTAKAGMTGCRFNDGRIFTRISISYS
jgi:hypothetical protein